MNLRMGRRRGTEGFPKMKGVEITIAFAGGGTVTNQTRLSGTLEILGDWQLVREIPVPKCWYLTTPLPFL